MFIKNPIFLSYTSLSDFIKCPRSYYLKNIYRDRKTGNRIQVASPYLSLGSLVHDSIKWFLSLEGQVSWDQLEKKFRNLWLKFSGKRGGFISREQEREFGKRGLKMLDNFYKNAQKLGKSAPNVDFPKYNLFEDVILMGNFDFIEEKKDGTLHVLDFKTGASDVKDATQLYIYAILAEEVYKKKVTGASFWYLDRDSEPKPIVLDSLDSHLKWLIEKAKELKVAIQKNEWKCLEKGNCDCLVYQALIDGKGEFQFSDEKFKKDIFFLAADMQLAK